MAAPQAAALTTWRHSPRNENLRTLVILKSQNDSANIFFNYSNLEVSRIITFCMLITTHFKDIEVTVDL